MADLASRLGIDQSKAEHYAIGAMCRADAEDVRQLLARCPWFSPSMMRNPAYAEAIQRVVDGDNRDILTNLLEIDIHGAYLDAMKYLTYAIPTHTRAYLAVIVGRHNRIRLQAKIAEAGTAMARGETEETIHLILEEAAQYLRPIDLDETTDRFKTYTAADAFKPQPPLEWIIDRLFAGGSTALVFGEGGSKKTFSMLDAAVCIAIGAPWLDRPTTQAPVLFVDEENGQRRLAERLASVMRAHGANEKTPIHYVTLAQFDLRAKTDQTSLRRLIEKTGARFIVIDSMVDVMPGGDENAAGDIQPLFQGLRKIADDTNSVIVVIHHANKQGQYRGSTAIKGAVDTMLLVESKDQSPNIDFKTEKVRDDEPQSFSAVIHFHQDQVWLSASDPKEDEPKFNKGEDYVLRYLNANGPSEIDTIVNNADAVSSGTARKAVYSLAQREYIMRTNQGGKGVAAIYAINPNAKFWNVIRLERTRSDQGSNLLPPFKGGGNK